MTQHNQSPTVSDRLARLLSFIDSDPRNLTLLSDAADTAIGEGRADIASDLLKRYATQTTLPPKEANLAGLAALQLGDAPTAAEIFGQLLWASPNDPTVRFNLAWARAAQKDFKGAFDLLDPGTIEALPQAAMLHLQLLHDRGDIKDAIEIARQYLAMHPDYPGLLAAVSVLALDADDPSLAQDCATRAGNQPEALATLGTLALKDGQTAKAQDLFARSLQSGAGIPRAWIGIGLANLIGGDSSRAASEIERGAEIFVGHQGSWIAAGWAHVLAKQPADARRCFSTALDIDRNFSEAHGSIAVMDIVDGRLDEARRATTTALRLDPKSFSGALANALLLASAGKSDVASALIARALHTPIDASGQTIAKAMVQLGLSS